MNQEPSYEELSDLLSELYWDLEYGDMTKAVAKLRKLIEDAQQREREKGK